MIRNAGHVLLILMLNFHNSDAKRTYGMFELTPDRPVAMIGKVSFPSSNKDSIIKLNLTGEVGRFVARTTPTTDRTCYSN